MKVIFPNYVVLKEPGVVHLKYTEENELTQFTIAIVLLASVFCFGAYLINLLIFILAVFVSLATYYFYLRDYMMRKNRLLIFTKEKVQRYNSDRIEFEMNWADVAHVEQVYRYYKAPKLTFYDKEGNVINSIKEKSTLLFASYLHSGTEWTFKEPFTQTKKSRNIIIFILGVCLLILSGLANSWLYKIIGTGPVESSFFYANFLFASFGIGALSLLLIMSSIPKLRILINGYQQSANFVLPLAQHDLVRKCIGLKSESNNYSYEDTLSEVTQETKDKYSQSFKTLAISIIVMFSIPYIASFAISIEELVKYSVYILFTMIVFITIAYFTNKYTLKQIDKNTTSLGKWVTLSDVIKIDDELVDEISLTSLINDETISQLSFIDCLVAGKKRLILPKALTPKE